MTGIINQHEIVKTKTHCWAKSSTCN